MDIAKDIFIPMPSNSLSIQESSKSAAGLPVDWQQFLNPSDGDGQLQAVLEKVSRERNLRPVYPPENSVFEAFWLTPVESVRVVLLGQDPYHRPGQAHGLSFSVPPGMPHPPSLRNILRELRDDLGFEAPRSGDLTAWARQGVLLLNSILTVPEGMPLAHRELGWEKFTDAVIARLATRRDPIVFLLWGSPAQKKARWIHPPHVILSAPHPSPLSAHRGFFGSRPFSKANEILLQRFQPAIDWKLL